MGKLELVKQSLSTFPDTTLHPPSLHCSPPQTPQKTKTKAQSLPSRSLEPFRLVLDINMPRFSFLVLLAWDERTHTRLQGGGVRDGGGVDVWACAQCPSHPQGEEWGARLPGVSEAEPQPGRAGRQTRLLLSKWRKDGPALDPFSVNAGQEGWRLSEFSGRRISPLVVCTWVVGEVFLLPGVTLAKRRKRGNERIPSFASSVSLFIIVVKFGSARLPLGLTWGFVP